MKSNQAINAKFNKFFETIASKKPTDIPGSKKCNTRYISHKSPTSCTYTVPRYLILNEKISRQILLETDARIKILDENFRLYPQKLKAFNRSLVTSKRLTLPSGIRPQKRNKKKKTKSRTHN